MITKQRRTVAGIPRHDVQENLPRSESRAGDGGQQRHRIMARAEPKADIQNWPNRQQGELDALEQAEGTRKFVQQQLRRKGDQEDQRDSEEAERIDGNGE
jgi:hypothetical protein